MHLSDSSNMFSESSRSLYSLETGWIEAKPANAVHPMAVVEARSATHSDRMYDWTRRVELDDESSCRRAGDMLRFRLRMSQPNATPLHDLGIGGARWAAARFYQGCVCSSPGGNFMLQPDFSRIWWGGWTTNTNFSRKNQGL